MTRRPYLVVRARASGGCAKGAPRARAVTNDIRWARAAARHAALSVLSVVVIILTVDVKAGVLAAIGLLPVCLMSYDSISDDLGLALAFALGSIWATLTSVAVADRRRRCERCGAAIEYG